MFDPVRICEILNEENVDYVVVGGFAAVIRGSSLPTRDIDIVPSRIPENLERLARALNRMNAEIRIVVTLCLRELMERSWKICLSC